MECFAEFRHKYFPASFINSQNITESLSIDGNHVAGAKEKEKKEKKEQIFNNTDADSIRYLFISLAEYTTTKRKKGQLSQTRRTQNTE